MASSFGDRRSYLRFEVMGMQWGRLELTRPARVVNISDSGVLIDSPLPLAIDAMQSVRLSFEQDALELDARVRHLRRVSHDGETDRYLIGLEFVAPPTMLLDMMRVS
jgi:hypothetical protein